MPAQAKLNEIHAPRKRSQLSTLDKEVRRAKQVVGIQTPMAISQAPSRALQGRGGLQNVRFYRNQRPFPDGVTIEEFYRTWGTDFKRLESAHNYIQWLFPCSTRSKFNGDSFALSSEEAVIMQRDPIIQSRLLRSFELILHFFGFEITHSGLQHHNVCVPARESWPHGIEMQTYDRPPIQRRPDVDAVPRLRNLRNKRHNFLRISRIIQHLGEVGLGRWQRPFLEALIEEVIDRRTLSTAASSLRQHWLQQVSDKADREALLIRMNRQTSKSVR